MRRPVAVLFVLIAILSLGAASWWLRGRGAAAREGGDIVSGRPKEAVDVILVTIDTWRADALGVSGNPGASTPLLDRLATTGRLYVNAHAHNVLTLPSHTNILTGRYPYQHGVRDNSGFTVPEGVPTLATLLKQAGYATGAFVGAYPLDARFGLNRGFDVYDDHYPRGSNPSEFVMAERRGDQVIAPALAWWRSQAAAEPGKKKPRFLWVHLYDPHASYDPPEPFKSRFAAKPYLGEVAAADSFLAPLLEPMVEGKETPALVIITGDHGEALGDHGELTHGLFAYESTLHVPLIVWGAGVHPGRDARWARHVDIVPTVLERLGLDRPEGPQELPGRSLLEPPPQEPQDSYFESLSTNLNRGWAPLRGVIRDGRKWIELPIPELYNLPVDPKEEKNLAGISGGDRRTVAALRKALPEEAVWPPRKGTVSAEEEQRLRSLGYSVGSGSAKTVYTPDDDPKRLIGIDRKLHQVIDLYSRGRYAESAALSREVIAERPEMAEAYEHVALSLQMLERQDEAVSVLRSGLGKVVADESLRRHLAQALSESGRAAEAVDVLRPFEQTGEAETLAVLGIALSDAGRNEEGERVLRRLTAQDESDPKAHENLGIVLLRMGRAPEARDELRRALALNESLPIAWNTLGVAIFDLEGPDAALSAWRKAYELDPRQYDALYNTGLVAAKLGRLDEARQALAQFARTAPPQRFSADIQKAQAILREIGG
jgi:arylsulfatase A-like enzyme/regulator of sirC expression with transglutaminase-like and TPR domain